MSSTSLLLTISRKTIKWYAMAKRKSRNVKHLERAAETKFFEEYAMAAPDKKVSKNLEKAQPFY